MAPLRSGAHEFALRHEKDPVMKKRKPAKPAAKGRRPTAKKAKAAAKKPATKKSKVAAKARKPAKKPKTAVKKTLDPVELDSRDSFPASDPPSWVSVTGEGVPDRTGRKRRP